MSESNKLPKTMPDMEHAFNIDIKGALTHKTFSGAFKYRIPNIKMRAAAAKKLAELNSGLEESLDPTVLNLHYMVSYLRVTLVETPEWWTNADFGYELYDSNVIKAVYDNVSALEQEWTETVWGPSKADAKE